MSDQVFLPDVSFLVFFKFKNPQKELGLIYYNVVPYINNNDRTKHKDLRTGKIFTLPKVDLKNPEIEFLQNEQILKDYGVDTTNSKPDQCFALSYRFAANEIMFSGILQDIAKATNNALPEHGADENIFVPTEAVVMLANGLQYFKRKLFNSKDETQKKEQEKQQNIQKMRNSVGDF